MKKKLVLLILVSNCVILTTNAQKINIGEKCPDLALTSLMNYSSREANLLTAFNNKPLIIDFWFIRCAPCIDAIIHLDSLQKKNKNQFNVLLATSEKEQDILSFFQRNEKLRNCKLPIVHSAHIKSDLKKIFPHSGEPHEVWIGKNGVVQAITSAFELLPENIEKFLRGDTLNIPEKMDVLDTKYAMGGQPLLMTDEERSAGKRKLYYSWIGAADPRVPSLTSRKFNRELSSTNYIYQNIDMLGLYMQAYSTFRAPWQIKNNESIKTLKAFKDSLKYQPDFRTLRNIFCYEIFLRDSSEFNIKKKMQQELDIFFKVKSTVKQTTVQYYVLSKLKNKSGGVFMAKNSEDEGYIENKNDSIFVKNIGMYYLAHNQLYNNLPYPVINETGYTGTVDITIPKTNDIQILKQALNKCGLDIHQEERSENILILQDAEE